MKRYRFLAAACLLTGACALHFPLDERANVTCGDKGECPDNWHCAAEVQACVPNNVERDYTPPSLVSAAAADAKTVQLQMSEEITLAGECQIPGLDVLAMGVDGSVVTLTTATQFPEQAYDIACQAPKDVAGNEGTPVKGSFTGFGARDRTPPELVSPPNGAEQNSALLLWTARVGARAYRVELSSSPDFATLSQTIATTEVQAMITLPDAPESIASSTCERPARRHSLFLSRPGHWTVGRPIGVRGLS